MEDIQNIDLQVKRHDGTITRCERKRTLVIQHLGKTIRHINTHYHSMYSNLISGQKIGEHSIKVGKNSARLKRGGKLVYHMCRVNRGGLWIATCEL